MDFLLIGLLTLLNGLFAMSEMALASSRKARLAAMAEAGDNGAAAALKLMEHPTQFLSTVQVGITSIAILSGIIGEAAFSDDLGVWLQGLGMPPRASGMTATVQALVWMRPCVSVAGTRCTRWPPDSNLSLPYTPSPTRRITTSL